MGHKPCLSFIHSFVCSLIHPLIHSFICHLVSHLFNRGSLRFECLCVLDFSGKMGEEQKIQVCIIVLLSISESWAVFSAPFTPLHLTWAIRDEEDGPLHSYWVFHCPWRAKSSFQLDDPWGHDSQLRRAPKHVQVVKWNWPGCLCLRSSFTLKTLYLILHL